MAERQYLEAKLFSRRELTPPVAREQLEWLADVHGGLFAPEKCDVYEPLKVRFDRDDLNEPIRWLSQPGGEFKFKRTKPFRVEGYIANCRFAPLQVREGKHGEWRAFEPKVCEPIFISRWTVWIEMAVIKKHGAEALKGFLLGAAEISHAGFAFLATAADYKRKNFLVARDNRGTVEEFVGDDPEKGLPGLYWMNFFGSIYIDWFGNARTSQLEATVREELPTGGLFLQFGSTPEESESSWALHQQELAKRLLGDNAFFDIGRPERRLDVPVLTVGGE